MNDMENVRELEYRYLMRLNMTYKVTRAWDEAHQVWLAEGYLNGVFNRDPARERCGRMCYLAEMAHYAIETLLKRAVTGSTYDWAKGLNLYFDQHDHVYAGVPCHSRWSWRFTDATMWNNPPGYKRLTLQVPLTVFSAKPQEEWTDKLKAFFGYWIESRGDDKSLAGEMLREVLYTLTHPHEGQDILTAVSEGAHFEIDIEDECPVDLVCVWAEGRDRPRYEEPTVE